VDETYLEYVDQLIAQNHKCSIATHDHKIQQGAKRLIERYNSKKDLYELKPLWNPDGTIG